MKLRHFFARHELGLALLACALVAYYFGTRGIFQGKASGDGYLGYMYLHGIVFHHSLDLAVAAPEYGPILGREATGHVANPCPIGPVLVEMPTYLLGLLIKKGLLFLSSKHLIARNLFFDGVQIRSVAAHGPFDYLMAGLGAFLSGIAGIGLMYKLLRRRLSRFASNYAVYAAVLATPITFYMVTQPLYQHACAFFFVTLFVERWDAYRDALSWRRAAILGALAGLAMLTRVQEAIILILPGIDTLRSMYNARRDPKKMLEAVGRGILILAVAAIVFLPQLLIWHHYFGTFRTPQAAGHMRWKSPALIETLFSTRAGLFPWIPVLYIAVPGLIFGRRFIKGLAFPLGLLFLIDFYVNSCAWDFHGSWAFGPRRFTDMIVVIAVGLGAAWAGFAETSGRLYQARRVVLAVLTALLIAWNVLLGELMRKHKTKSSCAGAYPTATWVTWAHGPKWLAQAFARYSYPFVQPAAFIYGLIYHMPSAAFEGIVGNYMLERDWRIRSYILTPKIQFREPQSYVISGMPLLGWGEKGTGAVTGSEVRLILPFSAVEKVQLELWGDLKGKETAIGVRWNGVPLQTLVGLGQVKALVPRELVHSRGRLNELVFTNVPPGSEFHELNFYSSTRWWE